MHSRCPADEIEYELTCAACSGVAGAVSGMAFQRAVAAGAATREGKVMSLVGLAGLGAFGCASAISVAVYLSHCGFVGAFYFLRLSVKDLTSPTSFYK